MISDGSFGKNSFKSVTGSIFQNRFQLKELSSVLKNFRPNLPFLLFIKVRNENYKKDILLRRE